MPGTSSVGAHKSSTASASTSAPPPPLHISAPAPGSAPTPTPPSSPTRARIPPPTPTMFPRRRRRFLPTANTTTPLTPLRFGRMDEPTDFRISWARDRVRFTRHRIIKLKSTQQRRNGEPWKKKINLTNLEAGTNTSQLGRTLHLTLFIPGGIGRHVKIESEIRFWYVQDGREAKRLGCLL